MKMNMYQSLIFVILNTRDLPTPLMLDVLRMIVATYLLPTMLRFWFAKESIILAIQIHQVFYLDDLKKVPIGKLIKWSKIN